MNGGEGPTSRTPTVAAIRPTGGIVGLCPYVGMVGRSPVGGRSVCSLGSNHESGCQTVIVELAPSRPEDRRALKVFLRDHNSLRVARRAELVDALDHLAVLAWSEGRLVGAATYAIDGEACEVLTLHAEVRFAGTGSALLAALTQFARGAGCRRIWVVTTNDNVDALRFYQRRGFRLAELRPGAVDASRQGLKPEIPRLGDYEIPLRDELELQLHLTDHDVR